MVLHLVVGQMFHNVLTSLGIYPAVKLPGNIVPTLLIFEEPPHGCL